MKPERWHQVREVLHEAMQMDGARSGPRSSTANAPPILRCERS